MWTTNSSWLVSIKHGCSTPRATTAFGSAANRCHQATYDNEAVVRRMIAEQADMRVSSELIPRCPKCGKPQTPNLRCDDSFVQDEGWYTAAQRYEDFLHRHRNGHILFLELGVGGNTPVFCSLRTGNKRTKTLRKQRISGHLQILTTNYQERRCA